MFRLQSGASSLAKHGGAYFSAVCGSVQDPIAAPGLYENQECSLTQILVNKSDKSDHPHQREPWCFAEVVNKVGAAAMPTLQ